MVFLLLLAKLMTLGWSADVKCHVPPSYVQTLRYDVNENETLVNTMY